MRKKLFLPIILVVILTCGCSAEKIAQAIDEDLGTNSKNIGSNIDKKANEITEKYNKGIEDGNTKEVAKDVTNYLIDKAAELAENAVSTGSSKKAAEVKEKSILEKMALVSVTDGDTIVALGEDGFEYRIRLIGIDTPESVNTDISKNNEYGKEASAYTRELLKDVDTIYIETDKEMYDKYSRLLAYVWLRDDASDLNFMVNAIIAKNGYCKQMTIEPNLKYASEFKALIDEAKENNTGLWQYDGYRTLIDEE